MSDIAFSDIDKAPCGIADARFRDSLIKGYSIYFSDSSRKNTSDSLVYNWDFGDKGSGVKDTSSLKNPDHLFSKSGVFTVCLYLSVYRENGLICRDTFCKKVSVSLVGLNESHTEPISITPNPAHGYIVINGTMPGDQLELINQYGQLVFRTGIGQAQVLLPPELSAGLYFAVIHTFNETVVRKIILEK